MKPFWHLVRRDLLLAWKEGGTVGIAGGMLTIDDMNKTLVKSLGISKVAYNAVEPDANRGFGFPGADELGNMFQVYRDFEQQVLGARSLSLARKLNPELQTYAQFVAKHKAAILPALN